MTKNKLPNSTDDNSDEMLGIRQVWADKERWKNRRQKKTLLFLCIGLGVLLSLSLAFNFHYYQLLLLSGGSFDPKAVICSGVFGGEEYRIIGDSVEVPVRKLLLVCRDKFGIWHVRGNASLDEDKNLIMLEMPGDTHLTESLERSPLHDFRSDWQVVIIGNNAKQHIPELTSVWRDDAAIEVRQNGSFYLIHIVWYGEERGKDPKELMEWLEQNNYVS